MFTDIPAGFAKVLTLLGERSIDPVGAPFTIFHAFPEGDARGDIAICVPIGEATQSTGEVNIIDVPGGATAAVVHRGSNEDMGEAYASIASWIHDRGHRIVGACRETYLNSPADVSEADLLTEIQWPIETDNPA